MPTSSSTPSRSVCHCSSVECAKRADGHDDLLKVPILPPLVRADGWLPAHMDDGPLVGVILDLADDLSYDGWCVAASEQDVAHHV